MTVDHLIAMRTAMNIEQIGSAIIHPNMWIRADDMITPTLPSVSAKMCRNTPANTRQSTMRRRNL